MGVEPMREPIEVTVPLGDRSYPVIVGTGVTRRLGELLPAGARRAVIVTQGGVPQPPQLPIESITIEIGHGEAHKTLSTIESIASAAAEFGMTRNDVFIGVGGGMVTDVAGFAAATYHRGTAAVYVSTSLLGMIDAAVGGKTGVNLPEGKNLVGAFWQPSAVLCDLGSLDTLSDRATRCGMGEMAKYHFLTGDDLLALPLDERIARCIAIKAEVVAADEREGGRRAILNYGHTLGHALEIATGHQLEHGEAVAIGLIYAARLAAALGRIDDQRVDDHYRVVSHSYGLDASLPDGVDVDELVALMARDKKAIDGYTFALDGQNGVEVVNGVDADLIRATLLAMKYDD